MLRELTGNGPRSNEPASGLRSARMLRELTGNGPPRSNEAASLRRCEMDYLWTAVSSVAQLPSAVRDLHLAYVVDPISRELLEPGLGSIMQRCPGLGDLSKSTSHRNHLIGMEYFTPLIH